MSALQPPLFLGGIISSIGKILPQLPKIFKPVTPIGTPKPLIKLPTLPKSLPKVSTGTKVLVGGGLTTATILGTEVFLQTPEGQATLDTLDSSIEKLSIIGSGFGEGLENVTDFFSSNPIVLPLIIGLGLVLVVKS